MLQFPIMLDINFIKNHPEEIWRWNIDGQSELREFKKGESVLDKPLEDVKNEEASKQYAEAGSLLKELSTAKFEIEGTDSSDGKTLNDIPAGDISPVGSKQNKIPSPVKGQR